MSVDSRPSALAQALYRREYAAWVLTGITLGVVEGATAAILLKQVYAGLASAAAVNLAVAFVSGAPSMSNLSSFLWANHAQGRARSQLMAALLAAFGVCVGLVGLAPESAAGLWITVLAVILARLMWAGILTVRASVWTANYPRAVLARVTGRLVVGCSVGIAGASLLAGWAVEQGVHMTRWLMSSPCCPDCSPPGDTGKHGSAASTHCCRQNWHNPPVTAYSACRRCATSCATIRTTAATWVGWACTAPAT